MSSKPIVLVLGATGQIGKLLAEKLSSNVSMIWKFSLIAKACCSINGQRYIKQNS